MIRCEKGKKCRIKRAGSVGEEREREGNEDVKWGVKGEREIMEELKGKRRARSKRVKKNKSKGK